MAASVTTPHRVVFSKRAQSRCADRACRLATMLSPGDVIGRAFAIYRDQIGVLLPAALIVFAINAVVGWVFDHGVLALVAVVVSLVLAFLYDGMVVQLVRDLQD